MQYQVVIVGAGAIGSIIGAHLVRAGHSVAMLARGRRAEHLEQHGLSLCGLTEFAVPVTVLREPAKLSQAEVLIIATKAPGTKQLLDDLRHVDVGLAFSIQNGPIKNELLSDTFGAERVLGSLADTSGELLSDGRVLFTRNVNILLGELPGELSERARSTASMLETSGVHAKAVEGIVSLEWSKFVTWVGMFALSVLTRAVTWRYLADPDSALMLVRITREMGCLASALGIQIADNANMPAASLCTLPESAAVGLLQKRAEVFERNSPEHRMSSLQDLNAGRPLELHETLGYAVRKASECGVPVPLLEGLYRVISAAERIRLASGA